MGTAPWRRSARDSASKAEQQEALVSSMAGSGSETSTRGGAGAIGVGARAPWEGARRSPEDGSELQLEEAVEGRCGHGVSRRWPAVSTHGELHGEQEENGRRRLSAESKTPRRCCA